MRFPLWSVVGEYQRSEWALISPAMIEFGVLVKWFISVVMLVSLVCWLVLWFLGGM